MKVMPASPVGLTAIALLVALATTPVAAAQEVIGGTEHIHFDRPEAWAMAWFASVTQFTGLGAPRHRRPWEVELGLELAWIPSLSEDQRRVGFNGTKVEDLNRAPAMPRPRIALGLPGDLTLGLAWVPPIEIDGVTPNLFAIALERPLLDRGRFILGVRAAGQLGQSRGDYTCSERDASFPPGSEGNPFGCDEPSSDTSTLDSYSIGISGGYRVSTDAGVSLHVATLATHMALAFQVDALTYGLRDRTRLVTEGWTWSIAAGVEAPLGASTSISVEAFYSPLEVRRDPLSAATENDALLNLRAMLRYVFR